MNVKELILSQPAADIAAALIDRTVHHGRLIRFEGGSYRSEHALMTR